MSVEQEAMDHFEVLRRERILNKKQNKEGAHGVANDAGFARLSPSLPAEDSPAPIAPRNYYRYSGR